MLSCLQLAYGFSLSKDESEGLGILASVRRHKQPRQNLLCTLGIRRNSGKNKYKF